MKTMRKKWVEEYTTENKDGVEVLCSHQLNLLKLIILVRRFGNIIVVEKVALMKQLHVLLRGNG